MIFLLTVYMFKHMSHQTALCIEPWITQSHVILIFYHSYNSISTNGFLNDVWCFYDRGKTPGSATHVTGWMLMAKVSPSQSAVCLRTSVCPQAACSMKPTWYLHLLTLRLPLVHKHTALCSAVGRRISVFWYKKVHQVLFHIRHCSCLKILIKIKYSNRI